MQDLKAYCRTFYASHFLPIAYYERGEERCAMGFPEDVPTYRTVLRDLLATPQNPAVCVMPDMGLYGIVRLRDADAFLVVGPAYGGDITEEVVRAYMAANAIRRERQEDITQSLQSIPRFSYNLFVNLLVHLHLVLNGEEISIYDHFYTPAGDPREEEIAARHAEGTCRAREAKRQHGTYAFEQLLLDYVSQGEPERMSRFLLDSAGTQPLAEGTLADTPLRQAKNVFVGIVTMAGKAGAIPGGMDVEQTYQLIDTYIQECERLQSLDEIKQLQFNMLMDFTSRVQRAKLPHDVSGEVFACIQFIGTHLTEPIGVGDVAASIGRSRAYLGQKFKRELGTTVGAYITRCRMREAKTLLRHTGMSLAEISDYLHFSSQPYFQNVFRKTWGVTPARYRAQHAAR